MNGGRRLWRRLISRKGAFLLFIAASPLLLLQVVPAILSQTQCGGSGSVPTGNRVALINTLSQNQDDSFVKAVGALASNAGYGFDYYPFGQGSVDFFKHLPQKGYSIILLRTDSDAVTGAVATSDRYNQYQYPGEQLSDSVARIKVNGTFYEYFGLTPKFIQNMCGRFSATTILAMGCFTMSSTDMAQAFVEKGAGAFVGWDKGVLAAYTDTVFASLLGFVLQGKSISYSVNQVMQTFGSDPSYQARLHYYPT
jgi:hypothetical protein